MSLWVSPAARTVASALPFALLGLWYFARAVIRSTNTDAFSKVQLPYLVLITTVEASLTA